MLQFEAVGTHWTIDFYEDLSAVRQADLLKQIETYIAEFDRNYSRFRDDSLVAEMSKRAGVFELPGDAEPMMRLYEELYSLTEGALTLLIGRTLVEAGYDAQYSLKPGILHALPKWEEVLEYRFPRLTLKQPALLDFGAIGKGYLIDIIGSIFFANDIKCFCIDAGGDLLHRNVVPLKVGLENPNHFQEVIGVVKIQNQSLCGSSGSRRKWDRFHHILDPRTLSSPQEIIATWTVASTTILADALATCLFFVPAKTLLTKYRFEYVVLHEDYSVEMSKGFPGEVFVK